MHKFIDFTFLYFTVREILKVSKPIPMTRKIREITINDLELVLTGISKTCNYKCHGNYVQILSALFTIMSVIDCSSNFQ